MVRLADDAAARCAGARETGGGLPVPEAGFASEPAALAYRLAFVPLTAEHFDLVILAGHARGREADGLLKVLSSAWPVDPWPACPAMTRAGAENQSRRFRRAGNADRPAGAAQ